MSSSNQNDKKNLQHSDILKLLSATKVSELVADQKIISVNEKDDIKTVFKTLVENKIQSMPIENENGECIGLIDNRDFVAYVLDLFKQKSQPTKEISKLSDFSKLNPFIPLKSDDWLHQGLKTFVQNSKLHRVPIVSSSNEKKVTHLLSHSTVLEWLKKNEEKIKSLSSLNIEDIEEISFKEVTIAKKSDKLLSVFERIVDRKISAVPIVDDDNKIIANLSLSDLQHSIEMNLDLLEKPLTEFIAAAEKTGKQLSNPITTTHKSSLKSIIDNLVEKKVHHVWCVDEKNHPIGVITGFDIIEGLVAISFSEVLQALVLN